MLMTPFVAAVIWFSSVLSLPNLTLGISPESCSMTGPMRLHGPHQGAQKSTSTTPCWAVNFGKSESVTVETAPAMAEASRPTGINDSVSADSTDSLRFRGPPGFRRFGCLAGADSGECPTESAESRSAPVAKRGLLNLRHRPPCSNPQPPVALAVQVQYLSPAWAEKALRLIETDA